LASEFVSHSRTIAANRSLAADTLAESVLILLVLQFVQRVIGFGRGIVFCRWLSPEELGQWEMAFSFLMLAGPMAVFSLHSAFGRYVEHYRVRGQLRPFFRRVTAATALCAVIAVLSMLMWLPQFSRLIFGSEDRCGLTALLAMALATVIAQNFLLDLFCGLRLQRMASGAQAVGTVAFAVFGIGLLLAWETTAESLVIAYAAACLVSTVVAGPAIWRAWRTADEMPITAVETSQGRSFWARILPFALWIWAANWLAGAFALADRMMIVHFSGLDPNAALALVGQYHSSRLAPLLFVTFAALLSGVLMPHLSHDWESGRRARVAERLNLSLKMLGLGLFMAGAAILPVAPLVFDVLFQGKFQGGLAVLPWTMTYCTWAGLAFVARTYLHCAERAWLASAAYVVGLVLNCLLNLVLLPRFGLPGAVWATAAGNLVVLALIFLFARRLGMRIEASTFVVCALPASYALGTWTVLIVATFTGFLAVRSRWLLTTDQQRQLIAVAARYAHRIRPVSSTNAATASGSL
jgi:O-antigen/teichoic acid export membrane protein